MTNEKHYVSTFRSPKDTKFYRLMAYQNVSRPAIAT